MWKETKKATSLIRQISILRLKDIWRKEISMFHGRSEDLALAFAAGIFIGLTPAIGFQTVLCYLFARILNKSFIITFIGSFFITGIPLVHVFIYFLCYKLGVIVLGKEIYGTVSLAYLRNLGGKQALLYLGKPLVVGCILAAIVGGVISYFIVLFTSRKVRENSAGIKAYKKLLWVSCGVIWEWAIFPAVVILLSTYLSNRYPYFLPFLSSDTFFAIAFLALGLFWTVVSCMTLTSKGIGTFVPCCDPPKFLVEKGVYSYCRNPMYLGYILLFLAFSIFSHSLWILMLSLLAISVFFIFYIRLCEEKHLIARFGEEYRIYRAQTHLLIPLCFVPERAKPTKLFTFLHIVLVIVFFSFVITEVNGFFR